MRFSLALLGVGALVLAGCGGGSGAEEPNASVVEQLQERSLGIDRSDPPYTSVVEAMPQVVYVVDGEREFTATDLYVRGRIVDVAPGFGFSWTEDDETGDEEVRNQLDFNASDAMVSTLHMTVDVTRSISASDVSADPEQIVFGLSLPPQVDLESARTEMLGMGEVAILLFQDSAVFDYDPSVWAVLEDGAFLGLVATDGSVVFPVLTDEEGGLAPRGLTIEQLEADPDGREILLETLESGEVVRSS